MLGVIISQLGINITTLFTTKNNSPCHVFIIFVFGQLAYYIKFSRSFNNSYYFSYLDFIFILNI